MELEDFSWRGKGSFIEKKTTKSYVKSYNLFLELILCVISDKLLPFYHGSNPGPPHDGWSHCSKSGLASAYIHLIASLSCEVEFKTHLSLILQRLFFLVNALF